MGEADSPNDLVGKPEAQKASLRQRIASRFRSGDKTPRETLEMAKSINEELAHDLRLETPEPEEPPGIVEEKIEASFERTFPLDPEVEYQRALAELEAAKKEAGSYFDQLRRQVEAMPEKEKYVPPTREFTKADRLRHKKLQLVAAAHGVRDLRRFNELVEFFEAYTFSRQTETKEFANGTSDEKIKNEQQKLVGKGYKEVKISKYGSDGTYVEGYKEKYLNIQDGDIDELRILMEKTQDPVRVLQFLRNSGFVNFSGNSGGGYGDVDDTYYRNSLFINQEKIMELFSAPHLSKAIDLCGKVKNLPGSNGYSTASGLDSLIQLANGEVPDLSSDLIDKLNVLSAGTRIIVDPNHIQDFADIINDPEKLEFASQLYFLDTTKLPFSVVDDYASQGLLAPATMFISSGIYGLNYGTNSKWHVQVLSYDIRQVKEAIGSPEAQEFLNNPDKQKFAQMLNTIGFSNTIESVNALYEQRKDFMAIYNLIYPSLSWNYPRPDRGRYYEIRHPHHKVPEFTKLFEDEKTREVFLDPKFQEFVGDIESEMGERLTPQDFMGENLVEHRYIDHGISHHYEDTRELQIITLFKLRNVIKTKEEHSAAGILKGLREGDNSPGADSARRAFHEYKEFYQYVPTISLLEQYGVQIPKEKMSANWLATVQQMPLIEFGFPSERVPEGSRKIWIESVLTLPQDLQQEIRNKIGRNMATLEDAQRVQWFADLLRSDFVKNHQGSPEELTALYGILARYDGDINTLFNEGKPTKQLAEYILNSEDKHALGAFNAVLTDEVIAEFDLPTQISLKLWKSLPSQLLPTMAMEADFPLVSSKLQEKYRLLQQIYEYGSLETFDLSTVEAIRSDPNPERYFSDGKPTPDFIRLLIDRNQEVFIPKFLTPGVLSQYSEVERKALNSWMKLPANLRNQATENEPSFPNISKEKIERYDAIIEILALSKAKKVAISILESDLNTLKSFAKKCGWIKDEKKIGITEYILENPSLFLQNSRDLDFINSIVSLSGNKARDLLIGYKSCIDTGALKPEERGVLLDFIKEFRVVSPVLIQGYKEAKAQGSEKLFMAELRSIAERMTGAEQLTDVERSKPYFKDLIAHVYPHNSGSWTNYERNESCKDRTADLGAFKIEQRYEIDLLSQSLIKLKQGEVIDPDTLQKLQEPVYAVQKRLQEAGGEVKRLGESLDRDIEMYIEKAKEQGSFTGLDMTNLSIDQKFFLLASESIYGTNGVDRKILQDLMVTYEFAHFEDVAGFITGTQDRVSRASNQDYALLCELSQFYSDRIKEVNKRIVEAGYKDTKIVDYMKTYFSELTQGEQRSVRQEKINKLQLDKLGNSPGFIAQVGRVLEGRFGRQLSTDEIVKIIHRYESISGGLVEKNSTSPKRPTQALYGMLRTQRERTFEALKLIAGTDIDPAKIHLGEINLQHALDTEEQVLEGIYNPEQFAAYTAQRFIDIFEKEKDIIDLNLSKFESEGGKGREVLFAYISKTRETGNARMVGGVCVSGDNPDKGENNMWDMPNYLQLILQDPETLQCQGLVLLHHFTDHGKRVLTASFNPSSTYLYSVDETALFNGIEQQLEKFAVANSFDMILTSANHAIRTNRTGGEFEKAMDDRIKDVNKQFSFTDNQQFSFSPDYQLKDMDVVWENKAA